MPMVTLNGLKQHYKLEGDGPETIVLVNGLADDLETWFEQMADFLAAGYRVLRFDNRGIGKSGRPRGPYTTAQMAADAKALVDHLGLKKFHLVGVSMGGMIAQEYALAYAGDLKSLSLCCTYAAPGPFCSRMFQLWRDMAKTIGVPTVMRDVTLWAFTQDFFTKHEETLKQFEAAHGQRSTSRSRSICPSSMPSRSMTPRAASTASRRRAWCWRERMTSSSRCRSRASSMRRSPAPNGPPPRAAMPSSGNSPSPSTRRSWASSPATVEAKRFFGRGVARALAGFYIRGAI